MSSSLRLGSVSVFSWLLGACLSPPPEGAQSPTGGGSSSESSGSNAAVPASEAKAGVIWNGDDVSPTAKGWNSCDTQPCTSTLELQLRIAQSQDLLACGYSFTFVNQYRIDPRGLRRVEPDFCVRFDHGAATHAHSPRHNERQ